MNKISYTNILSSSSSNFNDTLTAIKIILLAYANGNHLLFTHEKVLEYISVREKASPFNVVVFVDYSEENKVININLYSNCSKHVINQIEALWDSSIMYASFDKTNNIMCMSFLEDEQLRSQEQDSPVPTQEPTQRYAISVNGTIISSFTGTLTEARKKVASIDAVTENGSTRLFQEILQ